MKFNIQELWVNLINMQPILHSVSYSDVTSRSCVYVRPISLRNASKTCFTMLAYLVEDIMLTSYANHPWPSIVSNSK
jgi:hypothetical protein